MATELLVKKGQESVMLETDKANGFLQFIEKDISGNSGFTGIFGEKYVAHRQPKYSANFNYTVDSRTMSITNANGGTSALSENLMAITSSAAINGSSLLRTKKSLRYSAGRDAEAMFTAMFTTGKADSYQRIGLFDDDDGFYLGYEGVDFGASVARNGSVSTFVKQSDFNLDKLDGLGKSGFKLDTTKINIYRITYGYLGIAPCFFQVFGGASIGWITFHVHDVTNKQITTHIKKPYLPLSLKVANTGNNTSMIMKSGSVYIGVIDGAGTVDASARQFTKAISSADITAGTNKTIVTFANKVNFSETANKIEALLLKIGIGVEGSKPVKISLYKLATATVGGTYTDVDTANSVMTASTDATVNLTGAELLDAWVVSKSGQINVDVSSINLLLLPGEYATFTYTSTGTADVEFINRWSELF